MMKNKTLVIVLLVIAAASAGYLVFSASQKDKALTVKPQNQTQNRQPGQAQMQAVDKDKLPKDFPADIPIEAGAEITLNFTAINANGETQASREFISKKTVAENYALYQKSLKESGWNITRVDDKSPVGSLIFATKGNYKLNIRIYTQAGNQVRVSINNILAK